jgi:hypothetical protein
MSFLFPIRGSYQWKRVDKGQDFQTKPGSALVAVTSGVLSAGHDPGGFGPRYPILKGDDGRSYYYGHVDLPASLEGKHVSAGQVIARTGAPRGNAASPGWFEFGDASLLGVAGETGGAGISRALHASAGGGGHGLGWHLAQATPIGALIHGDPLTAGKELAGPLGIAESVKQATGSDLPTPTDAAGGLASDVAGKVLGLLWDAIGENALRVLLYLLFVLGGLALSFAGVKQLTRQETTA